MASTKSTIATQSLVDEAVAFAWEEAPGLGDHITWDSATAKKIGAQNNTGASVSWRRPGRIRTTLTTVGQDYSLPDVVNPPVGYSTMVDATGQLTINLRIEANLNASIEELTLSMTKDEMIERHVKPAIVDAKDQMNAAIAAAIAGRAGQVFTPDTSTYPTATAYAQQVMNTIARARAQMVDRMGASPSTALKAITGMDLYPKLTAGVATTFHAGRNPDSLQASGRLDGFNMGAYDLYESPVLDSPAVPAANASVVVAAPSAGVTNGLTTWAETWKLNVSGLSNSTTYPKGLKIAIASTYWIRPTTQTNLGKQVTFTLTEDVTSSGSGTATFTLSEPLVYSGNYKNVDINTAVPNGTSVSFVGAAVGASVAKPVYLFDPTAIIGCSPDVLLPAGLPYSRKFRAKNGVNFALVQAPPNANLQTVVKLVGFAGIAVPKPEGVSVIYGL